MMLASYLAIVRRSTSAAVSEMQSYCGIWTVPNGGTNQNPSEPVFVSAEPRACD